MVWCVLLAGLVLAAEVGLRPALDPIGPLGISGIVLGAALVVAAVQACLARGMVAFQELWATVVLLSALATHVCGTLALAHAADSAAPPTELVAAVDVGLLGATVLLSTLTPTWARRLPPAALGVALGLAATTALAITPPELTAATTFGQGIALAGVVIAGYAWAGFTIRRSGPWSPTTGAGIMVAMLALGLARAAEIQPAATTWVGHAGSASKIMAAAFFSSTLYVVLTRELRANRGQIALLREQLRESQEQLRRERATDHTVRNLVAGISMASEILEEDELAEPVRRRLEHRIHVEAGQLCRLLNDHDDNRAVSPTAADEPWDAASWSPPQQAGDEHVGFQPHHA